MSELDAFRPRILNWARLYRNRFRRMQSPLAKVLDTLKLLRGDPKMFTQADLIRLDQADADLVNACYMQLTEDRRRVLFVAYLDRHCAETYEECSDLRRAEIIKAQKVKCVRVKDYRAFLADAERALMERVHAVEDANLTNERNGETIASKH